MMPGGHDEAEELADQTLLGSVQDLLLGQVAQFHAGVASGAIAFDPGRPGAGLPATLSGLFGRRRDRALYVAEHGEQDDPSLYGQWPEDAAMSALRSVLWVARYSPEHPVQLTPSRTGMLYATYGLPGEVTVGSLLLFDRPSAGDLVVTAASLVAASEAARPSAGNEIAGPGGAIAEELLVPAAGPAPLPVPAPERASTHRVLEVPLDFVDFTHRLLPPSPGEPDELSEIPAVTRSGEVRRVPVRSSTLGAIGWLDPFAASHDVEPAEAVFLGVGDRELYWWSYKTGLRTPRPR